MIGIVVMAAMSAIDYRRLPDFAPVLYGASIVILLAVFSPVGHKSKGAQAWFQIGPYQLEPSEFAKIGLIVALATLCARCRGRHRLRPAVRDPVRPAVPFALIYKQPDLGTALVLGAILIGVLLVAGCQGPRHLALLACSLVVGVTAVLHFGVLQPVPEGPAHRLPGPGDNTQASAYNLDQSKIAIGSGRVEGKGLFRGTQTNLSYVPEQHTDFIFTAVGEQLGLIGSALLLSLFVLMVWRIWRTASLTRDLAGSLICVGVLAMIVFQVFENVGMTMGIMPIAGIPLPFMSYGGSAMICQLRGHRAGLRRAHAPPGVAGGPSRWRADLPAWPRPGGPTATDRQHRRGERYTEAGNDLSLAADRAPPGSGAKAGTVHRMRRRDGRPPVHDARKVGWLLIYPDAYEIGLPNQGLQILYEILNERHDAVAERSYAPWTRHGRRDAPARDPAFLCRRPPAGEPISTCSRSTSRPSWSTPMSSTASTWPGWRCGPRSAAAGPPDRRRRPLHVQP